jgi:hypothetical protein
MKLTVREKAVLDPSFDSKINWSLYIGIALISISILMALFQINRMEKIDNQWSLSLKEIGEINALTEQEIKLKDITMNSIEYSKNISSKYQVANLYNDVGLLFFIGLFSICIHVISKFYIKIIRNMQTHT